MNKERNDVVIINLDRARELRCGHKAMKRMSTLLGKEFTEIDTNNFGPSEIEKVMYALMLADAERKGETLTLEMMEDILDYGTYGEIVQAMSDAFEAAFPEASTEKNSKRAVVDGALTKA